MKRIIRYNFQLLCYAMFAVLWATQSDTPEVDDEHKLCTRLSNKLCGSHYISNEVKVSCQWEKICVPHTIYQQSNVYLFFLEGGKCSGAWYNYVSWKLSSMKNQSWWPPILSISTWEYIICSFFIPLLNLDHKFWQIWLIFSNNMFMSLHTLGKYMYLFFMNFSLTTSLLNSPFSPHQKQKEKKHPRKGRISISLSWSCFHLFCLEHHCNLEERWKHWLFTHSAGHNER